MRDNTPFFGEAPVAVSVAQQRMEGLVVSDAAIADAGQVLLGHMTADEAIRRVIARPHVHQIQH
jgi:hypothetical protein